MLHGVLNLPGGDRESKIEACRAIRRWESSEARERHAELYERFAIVVARRLD